MVRRVGVVLGLGGMLVFGGCGRRGAQPVPQAVGSAPAAPVAAPAAAPLPPTEPYADPTVGVKLELPAAWSAAAGDEPYTLRFRKDGAELPTIEIQATAKADYLEIQKLLEVEQHPAAARVKAIAKEMIVGLTDGLGQLGGAADKAETEPEPAIVSDDVWTATGIIAGRRVVATDGGTGEQASQGELLVGESAGGALYAVYCLSQPADELVRAEVKQLLDSLSFGEPAAPPAAAQATSPAAKGDPADGVDAGAGADAPR